MSVATITRKELVTQLTTEAGGDLLQSAPFEAIRTIYRRAAEGHTFELGCSPDDEKLIAISAAVGVTDFVTVRAVATALQRSHSWVIRVAAYKLLMLEVYGEMGTYKSLLGEILDSVRPSMRDVCEVEEHIYDPELTPEQFDQFFDAVDDQMVAFGKQESPVKLTHTTNCSLTRESIAMIKILCKLKIYVTTSEFLRRAVSDYLHMRIWERVTPSRFGFFEKR
jgi:hypothetical protein